MVETIIFVVTSIVLFIVGYACGDLRRGTKEIHRANLVRLRVVEFANRCCKEPEMAQDNEAARTVKSVGESLLEVVHAAEQESK